MSDVTFPFVMFLNVTYCNKPTNSDDKLTNFPPHVPLINHSHNFSPESSWNWNGFLGWVGIIFLHFGCIAYVHDNRA